MPTLDLNPNPTTVVFRKIDSILRSDRTLKRVVKTFKSWKEPPGQGAAFNVNSSPAIRLTPMNGPQLWRYPNASVGPLFIKVEMLINGGDCDDTLNLWWAIVKAIYPGGQATLDTVKALQAVGANDGLAEFSQPAFDDEPDGAFQAAIGQIKIDVRLDINN